MIKTFCDVCMQEMDNDSADETLTIRRGRIVLTVNSYVDFTDGKGIACSNCIQHVLEKGEQIGGPDRKTTIGD